MAEIIHLTRAELDAGLEHIRRSPRDHGVLELIVRRPRILAREVLQEGMLDPLTGLAGDNWDQRAAHPAARKDTAVDRQLTIMNARAIALVAQSKDRWPLAGDQLYLDLDLSDANLPPGSRLALGTAVVEITPPPHLGCKKFTARFGLEAMKFVNSPLGRQLHLRGVNAKVVQAGTIRIGDVVRKV
jgi:MOSC domain-containing protein YiiM